jgi:hypothetical protein
MLNPPYFESLCDLSHRKTCRMRNRLTLIGLLQRQENPAPKDMPSSILRVISACEASPSAETIMPLFQSQETCRDVNHSLKWTPRIRQRRGTINLGYPGSMKFYDESVKPVGNGPATLAANAKLNATTELPVTGALTESIQIFASTSRHRSDRMSNPLL